MIILDNFFIPGNLWLLFQTEDSWKKKTYSVIGKGDPFQD